MRELANTNQSSENALSCFLETIQLRILPANGSEDVFTVRCCDPAVLLCKKPCCLRDDSQKTSGIPNNVLPITVIHGALIRSEMETAFLLPEMPPVIHIKNEDGILVSRMFRTTRMTADGSVSDIPGVRAIINHLAYVVPVQAPAHTWPPFLPMAARWCNS